MKSTGTVRKIDELGRIVVPIELRRVLEIGERDGIEIFMKNHQIILRKYQPSCIFCDGEENVIEYKNKTICTDCVQEMQESIK